MSVKIIKSYQQWANKNDNMLKSREAGLEPWEVFKLALSTGDFVYVESESNEGMISTEFARQLTDASKEDYFKQEYEQPITQEITDEERRSTEPSAGNNKNSSSVSKPKSSRKGK